MTDQKKFKGDIYTKKLILSISPYQWQKFRFIAKENNLTMTEQLRKLIDATISIYERNNGEIKLSDEQPPTEIEQ